MTLAELISQGVISEFKDVSLEQVKQRFKKAESSFNFAENILKSFKPETVEINNVYDIVYNAIRVAAEAFLLLAGYRVGVKDHHKYVIMAVRLTVNDPEKDFLFDQLDQVRKNRNRGDYDNIEISKQVLTKSMETAANFLALIREKINQKS